MGKGQRVGPGDARGPHPVPGSSGNVAGQVWAVPPPGCQGETAEHLTCVDILQVTEEISKVRLNHFRGIQKMPDKQETVDK